MPRPAHGGALALALPDGSILISGGQDAPDHGLSSTVIFDSRLGVWRPGPSMITPRFKHAIAALPDGRILVLGGTTDDTQLLAGTEIFDPTTKQFAPGPAMTVARHKFMDSVTRTASGQLVVAGGNQIDVLAPGSGTFSPISGATGAWRSFATATALPDGTVLIVVGYDKRIRVHPDAMVIRAGP